MGKNIGFVSTRFSGTDGVSLESSKWAEVFEKSGGFDVVIANPPYVRADSRNPNYQEFRRTLENSGQYKTLYEKWDLFIPFIERGLNLLNNSGDLDYIVSNAICTSKPGGR